MYLSFRVFAQALRLLPCQDALLLGASSHHKAEASTFCHELRTLRLYFRAQLFLQPLELTLQIKLEDRQARGQAGTHAGTHTRARRRSAPGTQHSQLVSVRATGNGKGSGACRVGKGQKEQQKNEEQWARGGGGGGRGGQADEWMDRTTPVSTTVSTTHPRTHARD